MKITVKVGGAEVILEAHKPDEIASAGPLIASLLDSNAQGQKKKPSGLQERVSSDSELSRSRLQEVLWVLATNKQPMNAPEIAQEVKTFPGFSTRSGDPVHIVRRVIADGINLGYIQRTMNGTFQPSPEEVFRSERGTAVPTRTQVDWDTDKTQGFALQTGATDEDLDDPFADN